LPWRRDWVSYCAIIRLVCQACGTFPVLVGDAGRKKGFHVIASHSRFTASQGSAWLCPG